MNLMNLIIVSFVTIVTLGEAGYPRICYTCSVETENMTDACYSGDEDNMDVILCGSRKFKCVTFGYEVMRCRNTTLYNMTRGCYRANIKWDCDSYQSAAAKVNSERGFVTVSSCYDCELNYCNESSQIVIIDWFKCVVFFMLIISSMR